jgi:hypothetical protein
MTVPHYLIGIHRDVLLAMGLRANEGIQNIVVPDADAVVRPGPGEGIDLSPLG